MLQTNHIQHYPLGGENAITITDVGEYAIEVNQKITGIFTVWGDTYFYSEEGCEYAIYDNHRLLLRPMSDLYKERNGKDSDFNILRSIYPNLPNWYTFFKDWIDNKRDLSETIIEYAVMQYLFDNHYDVFGLIEKGLAVDINTIKP